MENKDKGSAMICVGFILIILDFTVFIWLPSFAISFFGICLICSGIRTKSKYSKTSSKYSSMQYNRQATPQYQRPAEQGYQRPTVITQPPVEQRVIEHSFCPSCGARASGNNFCPECGTKIE